MFGKGFGTTTTKSGFRSRDTAQEEEEQLAPRISKADEALDVKSLDRQGERNLYLLVKRPSGATYEWQFPHGTVEPGEFLHQVRYMLWGECIGILIKGARRHAES